jgi:hypothetical protein
MPSLHEKMKVSVNYEAHISEAELMLLSTVLGEELHIANPVVWCAELATSHSKIVVLPEEVPTPDKEHPYGTVDRIKISIAGASTSSTSSGPLQRLGTVQAVEVISTVVAFTRVKKYPSQNLAGVTLPASTGYGYIYHHPDQLEALQIAFPEEDALVSLDMGVKFVTDNNPNVILYTSGYFVHAAFDGLSDQIWKTSNSYRCYPLQRRLMQAHGHLN